MDTAAIIRITTEVWFMVFCCSALISLFIAKVDDSRSNRIMYLVAAFAAVYMLTDILAVYFRGSSTIAGGIVVRLANFFYYVIGVCLTCMVGEYQWALMKEGGKKFDFPARRYIYVIRYVAIAMILLTVLTQYFNIFYYFDSENYYSRGRYFLLYEVMHMCLFLTQLLFTIKSRKVLPRLEYMGLLCFCLVPTVCTLIQALFYGSFFGNISVAACVILLSMIALRRQSLVLQEREKELHDMRINLLVSQIQPHFIFNSLTAIQSEIIDNPEEAYDSISDFSDFLRGVMTTMSQKDTITVEEDLKTAHGYMKIEQMRFKDKIHFEEYIEDSGFLVPPLTIQPILENAIRHGIRKKGYEGTVTLSIRKEGGCHIIGITDDGVGFDPAAVYNDDKPHIGLENVRSRIESICGGKMYIRSSPGKGTTVLMQFPEKETEGVDQS